MDAAAHCLDLVRRHDRDRFLASLFAPDDRRGALLALYAFDIEIARIAAAVSEPMLGDIRLQWWRETLDALARGEAVAHPVAEELGKAIQVHCLPLAPFLALVDAHQCDLREGSVPDVAALETYLGHTSSAIIQLASVILAGEAARTGAEAAGFAGVALGLARIVQRQGEPVAMRVLPPGFSPENARALALERLSQARSRTAQVPRNALPAFLPVAVSDLYLGSPARSPSALRRQFRIWWSARRNRF